LYISDATFDIQESIEKPQLNCLTASQQPQRSSPIKNEVTKQIKNIEFSDNNSETNEFDSDVTENYEIEKIVEKAVEVVDKTFQCHNIKNDTEAIDKTLNKMPAKFKEYPHPKKRLTIMIVKVEEVCEDQGSAVHFKTNTVLKNKTKSKPVCGDCGANFQSNYLLQKHKRKHVHKFSCTICPQKFASKSFLEKHAKVHTTDDVKEENKCSVCSKCFRSKYSLKKHMSVHQKHIKYQCEHCSKNFWRPESYKSHLIFHEQPQHSCPLCDKTFYLKRSLAKHKELHKKPFECKACLVVFKDRENYELHNCEQDDPDNFTRTYDSRVTEDGQHVCGICQKVFPKRRALLTHRKLHSNIYTSNNVCEICNKSYRSKNILRKHMKVVHTETRDFVCDLCGKSFKQQDTLNAHVRVHDNNRTEFQCKECGKYLSASAALKVHMRVHQRLKPYMCDVCGMSFSQRGNLTKHMLSHTDTTSFTCNQCGKNFKYQETWKTHMRSHALKAGLQDYEVLAFGKFYVCEICQKKVASASQYKVHMRTHTNERPYPCTHCGKRFKESGKLSRHMRIHRPIKHDEHNYMTNIKGGKGKKNGEQFVTIAMKQDYNTNPGHTEHRIDNANMGESVMVSNSNPLADGNHQNVHFMENMSYSEDTCSDTGLVIIKDAPPISTSDSQIRIIDDSRHQFLMHQLTPVSNLIMESPDGRQLQVPSTSSLAEMHIMQVGFVGDDHVTSENHIPVNHSGYSVVQNTDMVQGNNPNSLLPYNKYFQP
jgi:uncharacterized Zn-finger protein